MELAVAGDVARAVYAVCQFAILQGEEQDVSGELVRVLAGPDLALGVLVLFLVFGYRVKCFEAWDSRQVLRGKEWLGCAYLG